MKEGIVLKIGYRYIFMIKRNEFLKTKILEEFINSFTFKTWQVYCRFRDGEKRYNKRNHFKRVRKNLLFRKMASSKTFKFWVFMREFRIVLREITLPLYLSGKRLLPQSVKERIKQVILVLVGFWNNERIDREVLLEWEKWRRTRSDFSKDIFIFSIIAYNYRHQRPQHLAEQLAKQGHRVFYIQQKFLVERGRFHPSQVRVSKISNNVFTVNLSSYHNLFIYQDIPSKEDIEIIKNSLRRLILKARIMNPIAKIDHPFWASILKEIAMPVIYDCMDEHMGFKESLCHLEKLELQLFKESKFVLVSSKYLFQKAKKRGVKNILLLRNAGDYHHFSKASTDNLSVPKELHRLKRPIIGYYGAIAEWFDIKILEDLVTSFRDASIVLIGRVNNKGVMKLSKKYKNIYLLGEKSYEELPSYLQEFDVATIPFKLTDLIKATNPVKVYEYLAAGKPVVATDIPELEAFADVVYIAKTRRGFLNKVKKALKEKDNNVKKRQGIARENTWEKRGETLNLEIKRIFDPKVSVVIVSYNNPNYISKCLQSIKNSLYPNLEIVVVDNGSNLKTLKILNDYVKRREIKLIENKKNLGFAEGNNIGIRASSGDYIVLLNNDTIVTPGWISRLIFHTDKENVGLVGPVTNNIGNEAKINIEYNPEKLEELENKALEYTALHWGEVVKIRNIAAFCWMGKEELYKEVGEMDIRFGKGLFEDDDYCIRVKRMGREILIADDVFVHHWGGGSTKWNTKEYQKLFEENKKKFEDKWSLKWIPHKYREGVK